MATNANRAIDGAPVNSLDSVRPRALKHGAVSQPLSVRTTEVVKEALMRHYGSLKCAALSMKPPMDEGQMSRELGSGKFRLETLDRLDEEGRAFVAETLHKALGDPDPKARAQRLIRDVRARLDELAEVI